MLKKYNDYFICCLYRLTMLNIENKKLKKQLKHFKKVQKQYKEKDKKQRLLIFNFKQNENTLPNKNCLN